MRLLRYFIIAMLEQSYSTHVFMYQFTIHMSAWIFNSRHSYDTQGNWKIMWRAPMQWRRQWGSYWILELKILALNVDESHETQQLQHDCSMQSFWYIDISPQDPQMSGQAGQHYASPLLSGCQSGAHSSDVKRIFIFSDIVDNVFLYEIKYTRFLVSFSCNMCLNVVLPSSNETVKSPPVHYERAGVSFHVIACCVSWIHGCGWCVRICSDKWVLQAATPTWLVVYSAQSFWYIGMWVP